MAMRKELSPGQNKVRRMCRNTEVRKSVTDQQDSPTHWTWLLDEARRDCALATDTTRRARWQICGLCKPVVVMTEGLKSAGTYFCLLYAEPAERRLDDAIESVTCHHQRESPPRTGGDEAGKGFVKRQGGCKLFQLRAGYPEHCDLALHTFKSRDLTGCPSCFEVLPARQRVLLQQGIGAINPADRAIKITHHSPRRVTVIAR